MREIKFRGKRPFVGGWLYGVPDIQGNNIEIFNRENDTFTKGIIIPKTLGQFTGLYDKNGKEVFEGDIVKDDYKRIMKIGEWRYKPCFIAVSETNFHHADFFEWLIGDTNILECEIIGNIHENPELLKQ